MSKGVNFGDLLQVLFIGLKLSGHIDWSWWWVMAPAWAGFMVGLAGGMFKRSRT